MNERIRRISGFIPVLISLTTLFVLSLWTIDISVSTLNGVAFMRGAGLNVKGVLTNLVVSDGVSANFMYHVGLISALLIFLILISILTIIYIRYVFGKDAQP